MSHPDLDLALLRQWLDKTETRHDQISPAFAAALAATLDGPRQPQVGDALPPLWHWIYFWSVCRQSEVGADGHPQRGGFLPPVPLPRRMWAGGRLRFAAALPIGAGAEKVSRIASVDVKQGRTGALAFVSVQHTIRHQGQLCLTEEHDIVYRDLPQPGAPVVVPKSAPTDARWSRRVEPDPVLLFRYSALTFNGHRIHYDRSYVTEVEGYPGLIVHGPLIATLLADLVAREMPQAVMREFNFRSVGTLFDTEPFTLCGKPAADGKSVALWAQNERGELAMQAEALLD
ncbi:MaoC family dehydratase N-terminal domain-containing protein [Herbaspirillum huttiense F1]|uniref:MaoC family dehydratase N-terminal domain-containing protein n=1 Tax=Herbaspirillum huttiense subsp. lycopersici TaxID=3074428 RepID=A0ABU2EHJ7_9BURK|nr:MULTISPECIES: MaoC family dehydratase N-terminal domain-containing protein [Herbaspirillum]MDR6739103.1 3-methylfumaryl-CoA hydratase [Herbaspirillum sp. 1173]MDR9847340.1 MaoC family dehydratase N-terminal domain-containing protein [Herbaspirillum huttiense SE1]MDT0354813.1 MaoC family dehydratase N-terminal domain-containing protein [Herbaspirillum huttiense F1]